jgi:hypothetical protein
MNEPRNFYAEALEALEKINVPAFSLHGGGGDRDLASTQIAATVASAKANLALTDAIYSLRDRVEELKTST